MPHRVVRCAWELSNTVYVINASFFFRFPFRIFFYFVSQMSFSKFKSRPIILTFSFANWKCEAASSISHTNVRYYPIILIYSLSIFFSLSIIVIASNKPIRIFSRILHFNMRKKKKKTTKKKHPKRHRRNIWVRKTTIIIRVDCMKKPANDGKMMMLIERRNKMWTCKRHKSEIKSMKIAYQRVSITDTSPKHRRADRMSEM